MIKPVKGCKYDVVARHNGASLGVVDTLEYDDGVNYEEWLAEMCITTTEMLTEDSFIDEYLVVMRTDENEGYYHGIVVCRISSKL